MHVRVCSAFLFLSFRQKKCRKFLIVRLGRSISGIPRASVEVSNCADPSRWVRGIGCSPRDRAWLLLLADGSEAAAGCVSAMRRRLGCGFCAGKRVAKSNCAATLYPGLLPD